MTRLENVATATRLRADGLSLREIGERVGARPKTVSAWINDPDGSRLRARKDSYRGRCKDCAAPTDGTAGPGKAAVRCQRCEIIRSHAQRRWTPGRLIAEVHRFHAEYGRPPRVVDWHKAPSQTKQRRNWTPPPGSWPSMTATYREFGSWNAMIAAAGYRPFDHSRDHDWDSRNLSPTIERAAG